MAMERALYPPTWPELARAAKTAAGWRCVGCGAAQGALAISACNRFYSVRLSACHVHHDPWNPAPVLAVLCQPCHLRLDGAQHWRTRRRHLREHQLAAGQLPLFAPALIDLAELAARISPAASA